MFQLEFNSALPPPQTRAGRQPANPKGLPAALFVNLVVCFEVTLFSAVVKLILEFFIETIYQYGSLPAFKLSSELQSGFI